MWELFNEKSTKYNLRSNNLLQTVKTNKKVNSFAFNIKQDSRCNKKVLKNGMSENVNVSFAILGFLNVFPLNTGVELVASKNIYIYIDTYIQTVTIFLNVFTSL